MCQIRSLMFVGLLLCLAVSCGTVSDSSYSAHVWEDLDADGEQDAGEAPMAGVVIQIVNPSNGLLWERSVTDSDGNISSFSAGGTCGDYNIYLSVPDGYLPTTPVLRNTPRCEVAEFGLHPYP
jgi:hypothetical protein